MEEVIDAVLAGDVDHVEIYNISEKGFTLVGVIMKDAQRKLIKIDNDVFRSRSIIKEIEDLGVEVHFLIVD